MEGRSEGGLVLAFFLTAILLGGLESLGRATWNRVSTSISGSSSCLVDWRWELDSWLGVLSFLPFLADGWPLVLCSLTFTRWTVGLS